MKDEDIDKFIEDNKELMDDLLELSRSNLRTCNKCGWVYMGVSMQYAKDEVARFNAFFDTLSRDIQEDLYGGKGSNLNQYLFCWCKNPHTNFREAKEGDCPDGCTLGPIVDPELE